MKKQALRLVLRALGGRKVTPMGAALLAWQVLGARALARRERGEKLRRWARRHRVEEVT